jgi:HK97 family phage major capsid protein
MTEQERKEYEEKTEQVLEAIKENHEKTENKLGELTKDNSEYKSFMEKASVDLKEIGEKLEGKSKDDTERFERIEKKINHAATGSDDGTDIVATEMKAINSFMRTGNVELDRDAQKKYGLIGNDKEVKIMSVSDDPDAGYLKKPGTYLNEIIKHITEFSPVRQVARVFTTDKDVYAPRRTAVATASSRLEKGSMTEETTRKYGQEIIVPHEMYVRFDAYYWMIEDSMFNLASEAQSDAAEAFAVKEGTQFISGTGNSEPEGVMDNSSVSSRNQGEASTLTDGDALIKLAYDVNDQYVMDAANVYYMMNRTTLGVVRTLKGGDGHYLLERMDEKGKRRIEGYPVITATDMDDIGANTYPVVFGNFKKGYWIVDRLNMWILRDPYTNSDSGYETFKYRRRVGGQVVQPNAFYKLKIAV